MKSPLVALVFATGLVVACGGQAPAPAPTAPTAPAAKPAAVAPTPTLPSAASASGGPAAASPAAPAKPASEAARPASEAAKPAATPKPDAAPAKPAEARPSAGSANPKDDLSTAFANWGSVKTFRAKMTTTGLPDAAGPQERTIDVVLPDRLHMKDPRTEMIKVGGDMWIKLPTGWQKFAQNVDFDLTDPKKFESEIGASTGTRLIGPDVFEGTPCLVYEYTTRFTGGQTAVPGKPGDKAASKLPDTYTSKVWIAVADNLPRKVESADPSSPAKTTIVYYDYNAPITINPPT